MDVFEAVRTLLAVRSYQKQAVPEDTVRRIIESGRLSASARNLQPWHFVLVEQPETLQQLGALARSGPYIAQSAFSIVVLIENTPFAISDASRAIQSMLLTAWAEGVGSNWVGLNNAQPAKILLNIPDELAIFAVLPFGYPAQTLGQGKKQRKPLEQVVSRERFGQPF